MHAVQANVQSNTFVVTGASELKPAVAEMTVEQQLAANPQLLQQLLAKMPNGGRDMMGAADDDEMPELEEDFEAAAK